MFQLAAASAKTYRRFAKKFAAIVMVLCLLIPHMAEAKTNKKYASIIMDSDTGIILHERYADKKLHPASLTKIMTLLMAFEAVENGKANLSTRIPVSRHAASMVPSKLDLKAGSSIKLKDAIYALVTKSANDVAVAIAEHIGGSERNFASMMTRRAKLIGLRSTTFRNASGLHDPKQITTARDMAMLAQYVISAYPQYYRYFSTKSYTYRGKTYRNHNRLLGTYKGMDGMKTGYINASGFNLVASAVRNNRRIIGVVFGGRSGKTRNAHMASLLDNGFSRINKMRIAKARIPLPARKPGILTAVAALQDKGYLNGTQQASAAQAQTNAKIANMGGLIGQGDFDIDKIKRIETGMIAMAAHTNQDDLIRQPVLARLNSQGNTQNNARINANSQQNTQQNSGLNRNWSIQLGAYTSRAATDKILSDSLKTLPNQYASAQRQIAPLKTGDGWLFRGRLAGFTKGEALAACGYFDSCMTIAPQNN